MEQFLIYVVGIAGLALGGVGGYFSAKSGLITTLMSDVSILKSDVTNLKVQSPITVTPVVQTPQAPVTTHAS